ncbi:MAG: hypothetical protein WEF86_17060 [Gemmatimonadota bacterium]
MSRSRLLPGIFMLAVAACSSRAPADGLNEPRHDRNVLTAEELQAHPHTNLLAAIRQLRPSWQDRVLPNGAPTVFMDGYPIESIEELRLYTADFAETVEYLRPNDAGARFGLLLDGNSAIAVTSRR